MDDETYNGWTNRETWALMLHINNDQGLYEEFCELVADPSPEWEGRVADLVRDRVELYLNPSEYSEEFGEAQPEALALMAHEVGSLWRVNWREVVDALIDDEPRSCSHCAALLVAEDCPNYGYGPEHA